MFFVFIFPLWLLAAAEPRHPVGLFKKSRFLQRVAKVAALQPINQRKKEVFLKTLLQSAGFQLNFCSKFFMAMNFPPAPL
ncbi:MAG: hypothetical protein K2X48_02840 [Chitinophagaceae bacterium]|nr:hypothetical protein [Chitinophagaceae bacterium]